MAEKIIIAELDINTEALLKAAQNTKAVLNSLKRENQSLKKSGEESSAQFVKNEIAIKRLTTQYTQQKNVLVSLNSVNTDFVSTEKAITEAVGRNVVSITEARKNNKELLKVRNELNLQTKAGRQALTQINNKLDENNKFIKENSDAYSKQKLNIGNYQSALSGLNPALARSVGLLIQIKDGLLAKSAAIKASAAATNGGTKALKLFRLALISTGIGAIVVAIGSLIAAFSSTQKGIDAINRVLAPLKGAFQGIIGVIQDISLNVFGQLKDRWTVASNAILVGIDLIRIGWNKLTGDVEEANEIQGRMKERINEAREAQTRLNKKSEDLKNIFKGSGEQIQKAVEAQKQIVELGIQIEKAENRLIVSRSESNKIIKAQNKIAEDTTKTLAQREEAAKKSLDESAKLLKAEQSIIDLQIKQTELKQSQNDTDRAEEKELAELKAKRNDKETQQLELQTTQTNKLNIIRREASAKQLKATQEQAKADEDFFARKLELENKFAIESIKSTFDRERKKLEITFEADKKEIDSLKISEDKKTELLKLKEQERDSELALIKEQEDLKEEERIKSFEQRKKDLLNNIALQNEEDAKTKEELKIQQDLLKQELALEQLELNEIEKTELLKLLREQAGNELDEIDKKFREQKIKGEEALAKKQAAIRNKSFDTAVRLAGEETKLGKALLAIKEIFALKESFIELQKVRVKGKSATANATTAIAEGQAQTAKVGFPQNIPLLLGFAAQVGGIISAIRSAQKVAFYEGGQVPYGTGGQITGQNIPTQRGGDNILATVKSGEVILNKEQQAKAGGSEFFKSIGVPGFQGGGVTGINTSSSTSSISQQINLDGFAEIITSKINDMKIVAIVDEIDDASANKAEIVSGANI